MNEPIQIEITTRRVVEDTVTLDIDRADIEEFMADHEITVDVLESYLDDLFKYVTASRIRHSNVRTNTTSVTQDIDEQPDPEYTLTGFTDEPLSL